MESVQPGRFEEFGNIRGEYVCLDVSKAPLLDEMGRLVGIVGCARDIKQEKENQHTLRRSTKTQAVLREIAEAALHAASLDALYTKTHQPLLQVLPTKNLFIAFLDKVSGEILVPYCEDETGAIPRRRLTGKGITEYTMGQGRTVHLTQEKYDDLCARGKIELRLAPFLEWLGDPLANSAGEVIGVRRRNRF